MPAGTSEEPAPAGAGRPPLDALAVLLRRDPVLPRVATAPGSTVAVSEAAVPVVVAALHWLSGRRPQLVVTPTAADAIEAIVDDGIDAAMTRCNALP